MLDSTSAPSAPVRLTAIDNYVPGASGPALFTHNKREQWGLGLVTQKLDDRVEIRFQDGRARTFKKGYYHFLSVADRPLDVTLRLATALAEMGGAPAPLSAAERRDQITLDEQMGYLRHLHEEGFQSESYTEHHRGDGRKRPLRRHRDPLVKRASKLDRKFLKAALSEGRADEVFEAMGSLLKVTGLVPAKERRAFAAIEAEHRPEIARTLFGVLHGTGELPPRFDAFVRALEKGLGETPTWALSTLFLGAVSPKAHLVVQQKPLQRQARWLAPSLMVSDRPMGILYERLLEMTTNLDQQLRAADFAPRDNFDLLDFMALTLKPSGQREIRELRDKNALPTITVAEEDEKAEALAA